MFAPHEDDDYMILTSSDPNVQILWLNDPRLSRVCVIIISQALIVYDIIIINYYTILSKLLCLSANSGHVFSLCYI